MMSVKQLLTYFDNECSLPQEFCNMVRKLNEKGYHVDMTHYDIQDYIMKLLFNYDDFSHDDSITYIV